MTGPVCALTASIWRTRSSSLAGVGQLVLADAIAGVIGDRGDCRKPGLHVAAPSQPVDVVAGLCVAHENAGGDHALRDFRRPWRKPRAHRDRSPDRGRSPPWRRAESSTACLWRARAPPRWRARHRAAPEFPPARPGAGRSARKGFIRVMCLLRGVQAALRISIRERTHYLNPVGKPEVILIAGPTASGKSGARLGARRAGRRNDHQCQFDAGLPRPAGAHGAAERGRGEAAAASSLRPCRRGGKLFRRPLARRCRGSARSGAAKRAPADCSSAARGSISRR